jgi:hypothetical protein
MSKIRVNSWLSNTQYAVRNTHDEIASTTVENPLQIHPLYAKQSQFSKKSNERNLFNNSRLCKKDSWSTR